MRIAAILAALLAAAIPLAIDDGSWIVGGALLGGGFLLGGVLRPSLGLAVGGGALVLAAYAAALVAAGAAPGPVEATALGLALAFVVDAADFARVFRGAVVTPAVLARTRRHAAVTAALGIAAAAALIGLVQLVDPGAPPVLRPLLAGAGALLALGAALAMLGKRDGER